MVKLTESRKGDFLLQDAYNEMSQLGLEMPSDQYSVGVCEGGSECLLSDAFDRLKPNEESRKTLSISQLLGMLPSTVSCEIEGTPFSGSLNIQKFDSCYKAFYRLKPNDMSIDKVDEYYLSSTADRLVDALSGLVTVLAKRCVYKNKRYYDGREITDDEVDWKEIKPGDIILEGDIDKNPSYRVLTYVAGNYFEYFNNGYYCSTKPEYCHYLVKGQKGCGGKLIRIKYNENQ